MAFYKVLETEQLLPELRPADVRIAPLDIEVLGLKQPPFWPKLPRGMAAKPKAPKRPGGPGASGLDADAPLAEPAAEMLDHPAIADGDLAGPEEDVGSSDCDAEAEAEEREQEAAERESWLNVIEDALCQLNEAEAAAEAVCAGDPVTEPPEEDLAAREDPVRPAAPPGNLDAAGSMDFEPPGDRVADLPGHAAHSALPAAPDGNVDAMPKRERTDRVWAGVRQWSLW